MPTDAASLSLTAPRVYSYNARRGQFLHTRIGVVRKMQCLRRGFCTLVLLVLIFTGEYVFVVKDGIPAVFGTRAPLCWSISWDGNFGTKQQTCKQTSSIHSSFLCCYTVEPLIMNSSIVKNLS